MPNDNGLDTLVADPDFLKLNTSDMRKALSGVSGDDAYMQLNDAQTRQYVATHRALVNAPAPPVISRNTRTGLPQTINDVTGIPTTAAAVGSLAGPEGAALGAGVGSAADA